MQTSLCGIYMRLFKKVVLRRTQSTFHLQLLIYYSITNILVCSFKIVTFSATCLLYEMSVTLQMKALLHIATYSFSNAFERVQNIFFFVLNLINSLFLFYFLQHHHSLQLLQSPQRLCEKRYLCLLLKLENTTQFKHISLFNTGLQSFHLQLSTHNF